MKVIDEKGKLFGKINLVDFLVIVLLVLVIAAVAWKLLGGKVAEAVPSDAPVYRYEVLCPEIPVAACDSAVEHIGDQLMASGKMLDGHIIDCEILPHTEMVLDANGDPKQVENPDFRDLHFTVETRVSLDGSTVAVGPQELRVGKSHLVKSLYLEYSGTITSMEEVTANE